MIFYHDHRRSLRDLHQFLLGDEPDFRSMPIEEVREYLRSEGIDPKPTIQSIRARMKAFREDQDETKR